MISLGVWRVVPVIANQRRFFLAHKQINSNQMLREFFNTAMAGLSPDAAAQPSVVNVWMASDMKYSFVELRTAELATISMGLDKVELCGRSIHIGRPSGYVPPDVRPPFSLLP